MSQNQPPLIVHIIYRLAVGGLENGLVNLINHMPQDRYRHAIVCLTDATDFRDRIQRNDVQVITLHKRDGQDLGVHARLWKVFHDLRPEIVHTRNLSGLEYLIPAAMAGVPGRIHGEHGRDVYDPDGLNFKYNLLRKGMRFLIQQYIAVSVDLADWLVCVIGIPPDRVAQIYNGVDSRRFYPCHTSRSSFWPEGFAPPGTLVVGTVGRMEAIKDQLTLAKAFVHLISVDAKARESLRLVMVGDGALQEKVQSFLNKANANHLAWLPGNRKDVPAVMRSLDLFVLPSLREGISNTILEAMASGLAVVATRVGGNPELVQEGKTGFLVPPSDPVAMADAIRRYLVDRDLLARHGQAGERCIEARFSMAAMVERYLAVYDNVLRGKSCAASLAS